PSPPRTEALVFQSLTRTQIAGGGSWIRTSVGVSQQIYSLPPLATRASLRSEATHYAMKFSRSKRILHKDYQSMGAAPWARSQSLACRKCPQPRNGAGPRRADSGDGWLADSTAWRDAIRPVFFWAWLPQSMNTLSGPRSLQ